MLRADTTSNAIRRRLSSAVRSASARRHVREVHQPSTAKMTPREMARLAEMTGS